MKELKFAEKSAELRRRAPKLLAPRSLMIARGLIVAALLCIVKVTQLTLPVNGLTCVEDSTINAFAPLQRLIPISRVTHFVSPILALLAGLPVLAYELVNASDARMPLAAALVFVIKASCDASLVLRPAAPSGMVDAPLAMLLLSFAYAERMKSQLPKIGLAAAIVLRFSFAVVFRDSSSFALCAATAAALFSHLCTARTPPLPPHFSLPPP